MSYFPNSDKSLSKSICYDHLGAGQSVRADVLDYLLNQRLISNPHHEAGLRFRADFFAAGLEPHLAASYNPVRSSFSFYGGWDERSDEEEFAYKRWRSASQSMDKLFGEYVVSIICYDVGPQEQKLFMLTAGLIQLARHYGLTKKGAI